MIYVTGDTHGEQYRFSKDYVIGRHLGSGDYLIVCGDFGFIFNGSTREKKFISKLSAQQYSLLFVDGNHENFHLLNKYPVEKWMGGKVHVIGRDANGVPKVIHLMRGQVFSIDNKKIFTFGGAYSIDKHYRVPGKTWWPEEMPSDLEFEEAVDNLKASYYNVDYIITHAAPEDTMNIFHPHHQDEKELNNFLEWVRENVSYKHWYFGHLHRDEDLWRHQTVLWFQLRSLEGNVLCE